MIIKTMKEETKSTTTRINTTINTLQTNSNINIKKVITQC